MLRHLDNPDSDGSLHGTASALCVFSPRQALLTLCRETFDSINTKLMERTPPFGDSDVLFDGPTAEVIGCAVLKDDEMATANDFLNSSLSSRSAAGKMAKLSALLNIPQSRQSPGSTSKPSLPVEPTVRAADFESLYQAYQPVSMEKLVRRLLGGIAALCSALWKRYDSLERVVTSHEARGTQRHAWTVASIAIPKIMSLCCDAVALICEHVERHRPIKKNPTDLLQRRFHSCAAHPPNLAEAVVTAISACMTFSAQ